MSWQFDGLALDRQPSFIEDGRPQAHGFAGAVAWQKQVRDHYLSEGVPAGADLDLKRARVERIQRWQAAGIIMKYEWLGTMGPTRWYYGLVLGDRLAGVTCIGRAATAGAWTPRMLGLQSDEVGFLARGACVHWAPLGANSKLVSWTARLLRRDVPALKVLMAYADEEAGEIGTIYQACGWSCIGKTDSRPLYVSPQGITRDRKFISNLAEHAGLKGVPGGWAEIHRRILAAGWKRGNGKPKWRYVYILDRSDRALAARIGPMRQPYPKRVASIVVDAPAVQAGEGGSTPTATLHDTRDLNMQPDIFAEVPDVTP